MVLAGCQPAPEGPAKAWPQRDRAADETLNLLKELVTDEDSAEMGFRSPDEVAHAKRGAALEIFNIDLDRLKSYAPGADPASLLATTARWIYPVTVNGQVRSSVSVVKVAEGFRPSGFGDAETIKAVSRYRTGADPARDIVVRIPALSLYFLGKRSGSGLLLTPLNADPALDVPGQPRLTPGVAVPAQVVLQRLVPLAQAYGRPPGQPRP